MANYLGLDLGTSSIKAILLDCDLGKIISSASVKTPIHFFDDDSAEHDPEVLVSAACKCIQQAIEGFSVDGLGISSFAEAGLPLDQKGQPLFPIIAWFDKRSQPQVDQFLREFSEEEITKITGQKPGFSFGLFKWLWIKDHHQELARQTYYWMSVPDYLIYRLTGNIRTDFTIASRTMMFNQRALSWSGKILSYASMDQCMLPEVVPSGSIAGEITFEGAKKTGLPIGTSCCVGGHDHLCGAYASGGYDPERIIDSSGTSQAVIILQKGYNPEGIWFDEGFVHYHHLLPDHYLIKGGLKAAGKAFEWLRALLQLKSLPSVIDRLSTIRYEQRKTPIMLPFFLGSGTPQRHPFQQGALFDLSLDHSPIDLLLSFYEGMGFWLRDNIEALERLTGRKYNDIIAIGGLNQNLDLLEIKAHITQKPMIIPCVPQASATGAALLAAIGCGSYPDYRTAQQALDYPVRRISPDANYERFYDEIFSKRYLSKKKLLLAAN